MRSPTRMASDGNRLVVATDPGSGADLYQTDGRTNAFGGELSANWNPMPQLHLTGFVANTTMLSVAGLVIARWFLPSAAQQPQESAGS